MRSQAALSSSRPPSTDCSASIECGGTRRESSCGSARLFMARIIPAHPRRKRSTLQKGEDCFRPARKDNRCCKTLLHACGILPDETQRSRNEKRASCEARLLVADSLFRLIAGE